uniref:Uncharacterized protein n=1 Tax=Pipistrellus kuhlii TaxID=59472 RepID=A0A7J7VBE7_PIPKU|nr:hypothetical protein mPipKuh1_008484 [Pipistrellus kuhlii]
MKIHGLDGEVPQCGLSPFIVWDPPGVRRNPEIRGRQHPHHTSAAATAGSTSLGQSWETGQLPYEAFLCLGHRLGSHHPRLACALGQPWAVRGMRGLCNSGGRHAEWSDLPGKAPDAPVGLTGCRHLVAVGAVILVWV